MRTSGAFSVHKGGFGQPSPYSEYTPAATATTHTAADVTQQDVVNELQHRGYTVQVGAPVTDVVAPTLTKSMAISVAIDEALVKLAIPRTDKHFYQCPSGTVGTMTTPCAIPQATWTAMVVWCVGTANGYLAKAYGLPAWAQTMLSTGDSADRTQYTRVRGLSGAGLSGFGDWLQANPWFVSSVGASIQSYGEFLNTKNVTDAIKANTDQQLTKADALALVQALQAGDFIPQGKTGTVAAGASAAAMPSWMLPLLIGGGVLVALMVLKK